MGGTITVMELQLVSQQKPGRVSIDNFQELQDALQEILCRYENAVYTEDRLDVAKADKKELAHLRKELDERRKEIKRTYLAPYNAFEAQVKELLAMVDAPLEQIKEFLDEIDQREKSEKRQEIEKYYRKHCGTLGALGQRVWESAAFFDEKWLNKSTSAKAWQAAVDDKIIHAAREINVIQKTAGDWADAITAKYLESLDTRGLADYKTQLQGIRQTGTLTSRTEDLEDRRIGYRVLKLTGTADQMLQAQELLELAGITWEEVEDGMPQPMQERTRPDFDSFVAFDIETTGTYGAANGDAPTEITEIGAVRVVNGRITARFSELVNPGRKILPRVARLTGITDDMVADKPGVEEVIRRFAKFAGDDVLVGHNIRSSDLYYIDRAARRAGVRMENAFFDTYRYANRWKESQGWDNLKLTYLAEKMEIQQEEAHRAWCDAETNATVYLRLRALQ